MNTTVLQISIICGLLIAGSVGAQITSVSGVSSGSVIFADDSSFNQAHNHGTTYYHVFAPWNGSPQSLSQTDPTTSDNATGSIDASGYDGFNYPILLNIVTLSQPSGNTGHAYLQFEFGIQYVLGVSGLPTAAVQFPNFSVSGTVQPVAGSYASVSGTLQYYDFSGGVGTLLDTITYNWTQSTWGTFSGLAVNGSPSSLNLPTIPSGHSLGIYGQITFEVDPASISVVTVGPSSLPFQITSIVRTNINDLLITWNTTAISNIVQYSAGTGPSGSFSTNGFADLTNLVVTTSTTNFLDVGAMTNKPARYYRTRSPQ